MRGQLEQTGLELDKAKAALTIGERSQNRAGAGISRAALRTLSSGATDTTSAFIISPIVIDDPSRNIRLRAAVCKRAVAPLPRRR